MNRKTLKINRVAVAILLASVSAFAVVITRSSASSELTARITGNQKANLESKSNAAAEKPDAIALKTEKRGYPLLNLQNGKNLETQFIGANGAQNSLNAGESLPTTMINSDLNSDGAADLIVGYRGENGASSRLAIYQGNPDSLSARTSEAFEDIKQGRFPAPFLSTANLIELPAAPDFIGAGDFNRDGFKDIIAAQRGSDSLVLLAGRAKGGFAPQTINLPGRITSLLAENIDLSDGQADVAVALSDGNGASWLFLFDDSQDAFAAQPRMYPLPGEATSLAVGQLDDTPPLDILAAVGGKAVIIHGSYREKTDENLQAESVAENAGQIEALGIGTDVAAVRVGHFVWDRSNQPEIALLSSSGHIQILQRGKLDTRQYTEEEWEKYWTAQEEADQKELMRRSADPTNRANSNLKQKQWRRETSQPWTEADSFQLSGGLNLAAEMPASVFTSARMTTQGIENLIVADTASRKVKVLLQNNDTLKAAGDAYELSATGALAAVDFDAAGAPTAVLPMRLSVMTRPGLVMLNKETTEISYAPSAPVTTFTVNKTADTYDQICDADCSLRDAVRNSQTGGNLGVADMIVVPAGTYTLTIGPSDDSPADPSNQAAGDLDIRDDLTITGAGQATTIIQAGTSPSNGIDRVLNTRQRVAGVPDLSLSGVTVRNGRCVTSGSVANPTGARCNTGGAGLLHSVDDLGAVTISDSTFTSNWNVADLNQPIFLNGAGIYIGRGDTNMTNVTLSSNENGATGSIHGGDGGAILFGFGSTTNINTVTMTNCTVSGNITRLISGDTLGGNGGGFNGAYDVTTITGGTFSNNIADLDGGGIYNLTATTLSNSLSVTGNTAKRDGGGIWSDPLNVDGTPATNSVSNVTVRGNTADSDGTTNLAGDPRGAGGGIYHDRGTLNLTTVTIGGTGGGQPNTSYDGGGLGHRYRAQASTTNVSTITINGGSVVGNVANNDGGGIFHDATRTAGNNSTLSVAPSTIVTLTDNKAKNNGGGVLNNGGASATFNNTTWRSNQANSDSSGGGDGGAFYQNGGTSTTTFNGSLTIGGSGFANSAVNGGGIRNNAGTISMPTSSSITFNTASSSGGGISNAGTINALTAPNITNNTAGSGGGGGIHNTGSVGALLNAVITNNTASGGNGGGIFNSGTLATLTNPSLNNNSAATGGGIFSSNGALTITNGSVSSNTATSGKGGGVEHSGTSASTITGVSITNNTGSGINITGTGSLDAKTSTITSNSGDGITMTGSGTGSHFDSNVIHTNGELGIDLSDNGVTPNDTNDSDTGPNNLQNFPILNYVRRGDGVANVTLNAPNGKYRVQYYKNAACDASGNGEGEVLLTTEVVTVASGNTLTYFSPALAFDSGVREQITAIATSDPNNNNNFDDDGSTSEFSPCRKVNTLPTISGQNASRQQGSPVSNSQVATVTDPDQPLNTLAVTVKGVGDAGAGGASKTVNGVTVSGISVDASGNVTANIIADCTATTASFTLRVTDNATEFNEANFTVTVTPNTVPTAGNYSNTTVNAGSSGTIVTPDAAPSDNGSIASVTASAPSFTGTFVGNTTTGAVTINNAAPFGTYTVTVTTTDNCGATTQKTFQLTVNAVPTITAQAGVTRQQGSPLSNSQIATVNDDDQSEDTLIVTINGSSSATNNGVTVSNIVVTPAGVVTADVVADCSATAASFTLRVTDSNSAFNEATLNVAVPVNTAPSVGTYANTTLLSGSGTMVTPTAPPTDNGSVTSATVSAAGFTGTLSVDSTTGVVTISNANPGGTYTVMVDFTDNCGAVTNRSFTLTVNYSISGTVGYGVAPAKFVPGATMAATGTTSANATTDSMGVYQLNNLTAGGNYTVTPSKTTDVNGITTFDATLVLRHIAANGMGANALSADQQIAADTTGDNIISSFDATLILRFVAAMGPNATTGQTGNWKFVQPSNTYNPLSASVSGANYKAYLLGEVDGDWTPPGMLAEGKERQADATALWTTESSSSARQNTSAFVQERQDFDGRIGKPINSDAVQLFLPAAASARLGSTVLIPVWLNNDSNKQISSFSFGVRFDPNVLQPEEDAIETNNTLIGNGFMVVADKETAGRVGIAATSPANAAVNSGTLVYLRFRVVGTKSDSAIATSALAFETSSRAAGTFEDNLGNKVPSTAVNGSFSRIDSKQ